MNILHVCANPKPTEESASKQLAVAFFAALAAKNVEFDVNNVDLYQNPPPFLSYETFRGLWFPIYIDGYQATDAEVEAAAYARQQGELFNDADILVLTTPMWNFAVPAILKAWMDQVIAPNITFEIGADGAQPLHHIRQIVLLVASGGTYKEDDPRDALTSQVRAAFKFIGIDDVQVAWADGQNPLFFSDGETRKQLAIEAVQELVEEIAGE
ncbi:MAG: NAD(P)H-dependent oxidoreductase [Kiritimatiellae bacterium]|nr:NAD(P)H-dependent oxidoreductase [Kiritimatiellia bacterium]